MNAARMERGQPVPETTCAALWLTAAQIADPDVENISDRGVRHRLNALVDGLNGTRDRYRRLAASNGGARPEFNYSLLAEDFPGAVKPEALRAAIEKYSARDGQEQLALEPVTAAPVRPAPVDEQTLALPFPKEIAEIHEIRERERPLAQARFRAIESGIGEAWRKWEGSIHGILVRAKWHFFEALARDHELAARGQACLADWNAIDAEFAHGTGKRDARLKVSFKRLWRWQDWYEKGKQTEAFKFAPGIAALQDAPTAHAGKSKLFGEAPRTLDFSDDGKNAVELERLTPGGKRAVHLRMNEKLSVQMIWEILLREHAKWGLPETLSYAALSRFLNKFPKSVFLYSRDRAKDFHDQCASYGLRDYSTCRVMEGWVLDHGQDDFFVFNDYIEKYDRLTFPELAHGEKLRMWLTAVMDIRSRAILGYAFSANPSSDQICWALRMAVLRTGRAPQFGLIDNGEDFKKTGKEKPRLPRESQGAFLRLVEAAWGESARIRFSIGEHAQSKPIERWFGTKRTRFDSRVPSYCGRNPANRPDRCTVLLKQHKQSKPEESPLPPASAAIWSTAHWIETWYNSEHRHTGQCMGRRTPEQVFQLGYPESERQEALAKLDHNVVDVMLRDREARKVFNGGCVRMFGQEYEPDAKSLGRLFARIGQTVLVAADPHLIGDAVAFDPKTGERLGALQCKKLLSWNASKDDIRATMRHQRRAAKVNREYLKQFQSEESEVLRATGTESIRALPPGRPLNFAGAPAVESAPVITSDFVKKHGAFGDVKVED